MNQAVVEPQYFFNSTQHILAELERIDVLIRAQVVRARQIQKHDGEFQGLYISEHEIEALLKTSAGLPSWVTAPAPPALTQVQTAIDRMTAEIAQRKAESKRRGISLRFDRLARIFELNSFEIDILLICLAPELDLRYERLYAYLQDDVTKKKPSVDLVLNLLSPSFQVKLTKRHYFAANARLRKYHILHLFDEPSLPKPPLLGKYLKVAERVVDYLHGSDDIDANLAPYAQRVIMRHHLRDLILPEDLKDRLSIFVADARNNDQGMIFFLQGSYGVGKQSTGEALCNEVGLKLLTVNLGNLLKPEKFNFEMAVRLAAREAFLQKAVLYWSGFDVLLSEDNRSRLAMFLSQLEQQRGLTFLAGEKTWEPMDALNRIPFFRIEFPDPSYAERTALWHKSLEGIVQLDENVNLAELAKKFRLSGGQIHDAATTSRNLALWRNSRNGKVTMADLHAACRLQSNRKLGELAQQITPHYKWTDIILPADPMKQLQEIYKYVRYRALVYDQWGFDQKFSLGKGLTIFFAGASGTGKTMAAEIMAGELGLDLYKIDLSTVVSKYIGETEKNLAHIFSEAETSNAILFFDEADALFGKRSEVRDSHDRYANIEISYLLQKMDEYTGAVILATNLRNNVDDAFVRRMHFTVEFPFPEELHRLLIWQNIFPSETPLGDNIDFHFLARHFKLAGGNIKNIALAAALYAADDGRTVITEHIIQATKREFQKMGKLCVPADFGKYYDLIRKPL